MEKFKHALFTIMHPFVGFEEIKWHKKGSALWATVFLFIYYLSAIVEYQYTGFLFTTQRPEDLNILLIAVSNLIPFVLFSVSNWAVCTLFDGEGRFVEIYIAVGYALVPFALTRFFTTLCSNFVVQSEYAFVSMISTVGLVWSLAIGFIGLNTVHQYTFKKTFFSVLAALLGVFIILFLCVLAGTLWNQVYSFIMSVYTEITFRT